MPSHEEPPRCVVCGALGAAPVWSVDRAPIHAVRPVGAGDFGRLAITACTGCGHLSNAAFDSGQADELYSSLVLTNEPVSPGMIAAVDETEGGVQVTYDLVMEVKDTPKPACVAQVVYRYYR